MSADTKAVPTAAPEADAGIRAVIVRAAGEQAASYAMFEAREISRDGAFLGGTLFLEVDEEFTVELSLPGEEALTMRARVVDLVENGTTGMSVRFTDLDEAQRAVLERHAGPVPGSTS